MAALSPCRLHCKYNAVKFFVKGGLEKSGGEDSLNGFWRITGGSGGPGGPEAPSPHPPVVGVRVGEMEMERQRVREMEGGESGLEVALAVVAPGAVVLSDKPCLPTARRARRRIRLATCGGLRWGLGLGLGLWRRAGPRAAARHGGCIGSAATLSRRTANCSLLGRCINRRRGLGHPRSRLVAQGLHSAPTQRQQAAPQRAGGPVGRGDLELDDG